MRLLDTENGGFVEFADLNQLAGYAILSHVWDKDGEQTYQELVDIQKQHAGGVSRDSVFNMLLSSFPF